MAVISFGTNISALSAQRSLAERSRSVSHSFERLASGLRINRASDDAAGLAVAEQLNANTRLYTAAQRNISDGLSLLRIASGTLDEQTRVLNRLIELAEQAANGTYSSSQRESMNKEYQQLVKELGRLGDAASFNGLNLLRGNRRDGMGQLTLQTGITGSAGARIEMSAADTGSLSGSINLDALATANWDGVGGIVINDLFAYLNFYFATPTDDELDTAFKNIVHRTTVTLESGARYEVAVAFMRQSFFDQSPNRVGLHYWTRPEGTTTWSADAANVTTFQSGTFTVDPATGKADLASAQMLVDGSTIDFDLTGLTFNAQGSGAPGTSALEFSGIKSAVQARAALDAALQRLNQLSEIRGQYGALESRLVSNLNLSQVSAENSAAARSRIVDVDVGAESASLIRQSILQQVASAVIAQANFIPRLALDLLRL